MDDDLALIDLASRRYKFEGARMADALELGWTPGRFWQRVAWLTRQPEVVALRAAECRRLVALMEARRGVRVSSRVPGLNRRPSAYKAGALPLS